MTDEEKARRREYARKYRKENPEIVKACADRARAKHKDKIKVYQQKWAQKNKDRRKVKAKEYYRINQIKARNYQIKKKFGIDIEEYERILNKQNGKCAICGTNKPGKGKYFAIDHNHTTGKVRALLCVHCNVGLGHFRESIDLMKLAISYLEYHLENDIQLENAEPHHL